MWEVKYPAVQYSWFPSGRKHPHYKIAKWMSEYGWKILFSRKYKCGDSELRKKRKNVEQKEVAVKVKNSPQTRTVFSSKIKFQRISYNFISK